LSKDLSDPALIDHVNMMENRLSIGLVGCGAIGSILARTIDKGDAGEIQLLAVYDIVLEKAERLAASLKAKPKATVSLGELLSMPEIRLVLEAGSQAALRECALPVLESGKDLLAMSVGAFVDAKLFSDVQTVLDRKRGRLYLPSGAIAGLDGVRAATIAKVESVTLTTTKPPAGLVGAPGVKDMDLNSIKVATEVFRGPAEEACRLFPANVNVAASLSLAGIGPKRTMVRIIADPTVDRNIHEVELRGDFGIMRSRVENIPSPENPRTSHLAILSAVATLRKLTQQVQVGT
jgi:aspartate dehydrogenase